MSIFTDKAPNLIKKLMKDLGVSKVQAAAILGNIGHECNGFKNLREIGQPAGKGGYGWCQWTGRRRIEFLKFCETISCEYEDDSANYAFLLFELTSTERKALQELKKIDDLKEAVISFEKWYERAGVPNIESRLNYARIALRTVEVGVAEKNPLKLPGKDGYQARG